MVIRPFRVNHIPQGMKRYFFALCVPCSPFSVACSTKLHSLVYFDAGLVMSHEDYIPFSRYRLYGSDIVTVLGCLSRNIIAE